MPRLAGSAPSWIPTLNRWIALALLVAPTLLHAQVNPDVMFADGIEDCRIDKDFDTDRLTDCQEVLEYQTSPSIVDTDDDGFSDGDEVLGTNPSSGAPLNLRALGADPRKKTILLEIDWANDSSGPCDAHSHQPLPNEVADVVAGFANAPVPVAPGAKPGVQLIVDYGQGGPFAGGNLIAVPNGIIQGGLGPDFYNFKNANFAPNRRGYFHYMLAVHQYTLVPDSSGIGEIVGDDTIVSLFCSAHANDSFANTIMHELGHNLALRHGGRNEACNFKPNYNSVMNYKFQWPGVDTTCDLNGDFVTSYSNGTRIPLDENHLDELAGVCGLGTVPVDWNGGGYQSDVMVDVNDYGKQSDECPAKYSVLLDRNDWADLELKTLPVPNPAPGGGAEISDFVSCPAPPELSQ